MPDGKIRGIFRRVFPQENTWYNRPEGELRLGQVRRGIKAEDLSERELLDRLGWDYNTAPKKGSHDGRFANPNIDDPWSHTIGQLEEKLAEKEYGAQKSVRQRRKRRKELLQDVGESIGDAARGVARGVGNVVDNVRDRFDGEFAEGGGIDESNPSAIDRMEAVAGREMPKLRNVADQVDFSDLEGLNDEQLGALYDMANKYTSKFSRGEGEEERGALEVIGDLKDNYGNIKADLDRVAEITGLDRDQIKDIGYDIIDANPGDKLGFGARAAARTLLYSLQYGGKVKPIKARRGSRVHGY